MKVWAKGQKYNLYHKIIMGKLGIIHQRHLARLMTNSYKTLEWWFHRYPTIFGKLNDDGELLPAYDCPSCANCEETTPHMFWWRKLKE